MILALLRTARETYHIIKIIPASMHKHVPTNFYTRYIIGKFPAFYLHLSFKCILHGTLLCYCFRSDIYFNIHTHYYFIYFANISVHHYNLLVCQHTRCHTTSILGVITLALQNTYVIPCIIFSIHSLIKAYWCQVSLKQLT